jgi:hypothetical protein
MVQFIMAIGRKGNKMDRVDFNLAIYNHMRDVG